MLWQQKALVNQELDVIRERKIEACEQLALKHVVCVARRINQ
jgi:hypothetical protein